MTTMTVHYIYLATLFIAALLALLKFKKVTPEYHPILIFLCAVFLFDVTYTIFIKNSISTTTLLNIQSLLEAFLICWQAKRWHVFDRKPYMYRGVLSMLLSLWALEILVIQDSWDLISWFKVFYSFTITLIAIEILNRTMIAERGPILRNAKAVFSIALIFFYALTGLIEIVMIIGQYASIKMIETITYFYLSLSIITNFIYIRAVLCIPRNTN